MINFVEEPLDGRLMQKLMKEAVADGGGLLSGCMRKEELKCVTYRNLRRRLLPRPTLRSSPSFRFVSSLVVRRSLSADRARTVYGESFNSSSSEELSNFLTSKMREYTLELRAEYVKLRARGKGRKEAARGAEVRSKAMVRYTVLARLCLITDGGRDRCKRCTAASPSLSAHHPRRIPRYVSSPWCLALSG